MSSSHQRAFAQKLVKQNAADVRKQICAGQKELPKSGSSASGFSTLSVTSCDTADPLDFEDFMLQHQNIVNRDPLRDVLEFPENDVEVGITGRKVRTEFPIIPEEPKERLNSNVRDCVRCYTSDWVVVNHRYRHHSSSCWVRDRTGECLELTKTLPKQQFEIDYDQLNEDFSDDTNSLVDTPRGSWASFDLRNSVSDPLISSLLQKQQVETIDQLNESRRQDDRQNSLLLLYPAQDEEEIIERRIPSEIPSEHLCHRILVKCIQLKFDIEVEPIFASLALYDAKERKKISENFYFDMNPESIKRMLNSHIPYYDNSSLSRSCIFDITYPSTELFLVIKLEKVLQGDITECVEPYLKDDKNREKVKANAVASCERLGKYRMPFAWTAIHLLNVIQDTFEKDSGSDKESTGSNSLDRKSNSSFEQLRRKATDMGGLNRRGSFERREKARSWSPEDFSSYLDTFRPATVTVSNFFKQEGDKLRDEDLFKFLQDIKRPTILMKKLKCIPASLKLELSPASEENKNCLTPELAPLKPYSDDKGRPCKEILEFPSREVFIPNYVYRNILYIYPKDLNFANRTGSARNLTVKIQVMCSEDPSNCLPAIFGKSSCPEFCKEYYTTVSYHNKSPDFYDEIKVKLPADLNDAHHLLFTFYHISCQKKTDQPNVETIVGYTWLPLMKDKRLQTGEFCLPVTSDRLPPSYCFITPDVCLPGIKWIDNHKCIFVVVLDAVTSVHTQDKYLDKFISFCTSLEDGDIPRGSNESCIEMHLKESMLELSNAKSEPLVKFLPIILDKLIKIIIVQPHASNLAQAAFEALGHLVKNVSALQEGHKDQHGRHSLLTTYISYNCSLLTTGVKDLTDLSPPQSPGYMPRPTRYNRSNSHPDLHDAEEEINMITRGLDRTASMRTGPCKENLSYNIFNNENRNTLHEQLVLLWVVSSGNSKELALQNSWFFFELIIKSMVCHLASTHMIDAPRKLRFTDQYLDDVTSLVTTTILSEIIARYNKESKLAQNINSSLAFFLFDQLSIVDRGFVFNLIKTYYKQITAKISSLSDTGLLFSLKLDFLRIICSHEHFVSLNLPFCTPFSPSSAAVSPNPSISSCNSQSSFISTLVGVDKLTFADLSNEFRQQHFLVGLILGDLPAALETSNALLHSKSVNIIRNLMTCHDCDPRYADPDCKSRVATLYLPLLGIVMDSLSQLYNKFPETKGSKLISTSSEESDPGIGQALMAIAGSPVLSRNFDSFNQSRKVVLNMDTSKNLLICFLWVLKNVDKENLKLWWADLTVARLKQLLDVLYICISSFEYKGKKVMKKSVASSMRKTADIKSRLEDAILGQGSARSEMMMRRKERNPAPNWPGEKLRWRKEQMVWRPSNEVNERPKEQIEMDAHIEGNLTTETTLIILDTLENIVQVASLSDSLQCLLGHVLKVLLHAMARNQSTCVLKNIFATQRSLVFKFPNLLFDEETEQCADLCLYLLRHCSSNISSVRSQASASLYFLMRQNFEIGNNFARVKLQVTMSLSHLVGTSQTFSEESLRRSLKTILVYAEEDNELQETTFPEQVKDLVFNLHMILSDTVKMKEFQEDPEMLLDLMYRIAKGYQNSPDLRLTWLANMAQKHMERNNHTEAAMCLVHSAALVAEYLQMLEDQTQLPIGAVAFQHISPNSLQESAVSDDVLSPDEEGVCLGKDFTETGLVALLEHAASSLNTAGMFEAMNEVYKILIPIAEANRDYKRLANIHNNLKEAFTRIEQLHGKRVFGTYFRVGFYGAKFGDLNGEEFIYKEPTLTKLPEIFSRLENFYSERFGYDNILIIKDSNPVDIGSLDTDKAYIQITYVEPYFEPYELRYRLSHFDKNYNIKRFCYATPFTLDGRAHGDLHEQYKRKTILTTANHFPYVKTRIQVIDRRQINLSPIEVAIEDLEKKTNELHLATQQEPPDPKILQMVLQGCIGTTVNQGPMEVALVFLSDLRDSQVAPTAFQNKLRLCFKDFSKKCSDALKKNKHLIGPDQRDYQRELEKNYQRFCERLQPLVSVRIQNPRSKINRR